MEWVGVSIILKFSRKGLLSSPSVPPQLFQAVPSLKDTVPSTQEHVHTGLKHHLGNLLFTSSVPVSFGEKLLMIHCLPNHLRSKSSRGVDSMEAWSIPTIWTVGP